MNSIETRALAATALTAVIHQGRSLNAALSSVQNRGGSNSLIQELCYGTLRWYYPLKYLQTRLLNKPLPIREQLVDVLLLLGFYQLLYLRIPSYAAVSATVDAARQLGKNWATGLLNGVLRNLQRRRTLLQSEIEHHPILASAHPDWLLRQLQQAWPEHWQSIISANNARPPLILRVNRHRQSRAAYLRQLAENNIAAQATHHCPDGIRLDQAMAVHQLPGFTQGCVSIQDSAAQLAVPLLAAQSGQRVLDACAAPGGKTCHLLEHTSDLKLLALDRDSTRLQLAQDNLKRLGLQGATLRNADAASPLDWWDGQLFDRILLDAPCSGSGVIRRHPDIKLLRRNSDIPNLVRQQRHLLNALWPLLKPGGRLLYAVCSVLPSETNVIIHSFLTEHADATAGFTDVDWGLASGSGRFILPGTADMDGFFYACLEKRT